MTRSRIPSLLMLAALAGCSLQPAYDRPEAAIPVSWPTGDAYLRQAEAGLPSYDWRAVFADPRLQAIIASALASNQDLKAAAARIALARAQFDVQKAELLPVINAGAGFSRGDSGGSGNTTTGNNTSSGARTNVSADISVTGYEIDLFGRVRSLSDAAQDRYFASESAARATRLTLIADIADAWLAYGSDASLLALARQTAAAARESLRITQARYNGGISPRTDVRQAEIVLSAAESDVAEQTTLVAQDLNALRLLVGADVDPANLPASLGDAAARIGAVPAGLNSDILLRRPDVVEAEFQLRGGNAEIGAARAALFPRISLTGLLGVVSNALTGLFSGGAFAWQAGAAADYSIFSGGAGKANVRASEAQRDVLLATYQKAIQTAFADVANVLARRGTITDQLAAVTRGDAAAADNLALAELRYRGGIDNYLQELTARQSRYDAARALLNARLVEASSRVALYRALGGDSSI